MAAVEKISEVGSLLIFFSRVSIVDSIGGSDTGTLLWGSYIKDPTIQGTILGSTICGNSRIAAIILIVAATMHCFSLLACKFHNDT